MKKGETNKETLILLQQDVAAFYELESSDLVAFGKVAPRISSARSAFCYVAYLISPNLFTKGLLAEMLHKSEASIAKYIVQVKPKSVQQLTEYLKTQDWKL